MQQESETIDSFITDFRLKPLSSEFGALQDSLMLRDPGLTLDRSKDVCKANEAAQAQMKVLTCAENTASVNVVKKEKQANHMIQQAQKVERGTRNTQTYKKRQCKRCGTIHKFLEYPAWSAICETCGGRYQYASKRGQCSLWVWTTMTTLMMKVDSSFLICTAIHKSVSGSLS